MVILKDNWEYDIFGIDNFNLDIKLSYYYNFIKQNINTISGDILEVGVFQGRSLLATALLLKKLKSNKKVYGFDSFSGFPPIFHEKDDFKNFKYLFEKGKISEEQYLSHLKLLEYKNLINKMNYTPKNISSSGSFENTSYEIVMKKAEILELDNIVLIKGDFSETMKEDKFLQNKFMSVLIDCDIYSSYKISLPFAWERMSNGAFMYIDEYFSLKFPGAKIACDEFFSNTSQKPKIISNIQGEFERWGIFK
tara:strand:- start:1283 stop:2035 length:753 start_codon:yes stop_codon:yes gene_type:complete